MNTAVLGTVVIIYLLTLSFLGFLAYKQTKNSKDYLLAGRKAHPFLMAMSYGATFISSSAIIGFGGMAAVFGLGLLWLPFLNIAVGIIIAFLIFGRKTRRIGHHLNAHTFPEFLGNFYNSKKIQLLAGSIIFIGMPIYAAVVLKGGTVFMAQIFNIDYNIALIIFTVVVASYVITGGMKGVMYTDAFQGILMVLGMIILMILTYKIINMGFIEANHTLEGYTSLIPEKLKSTGHQGFTSMPVFGSPWWYTLVTSLVLGVGIGALAQPQLVIRFMTVKSDRELNRGVFVGSLFIFFTVAFIFVIGAVSNIFFMQTEGKLAMAVEKDIDKIIPLFISKALPVWFGGIFMLTILSASMSTLSSQFHVMGTSLGRDMLKKFSANDKQVTLFTRLGITVAIIISYIICLYLPEGVIARGTAIFFGICAASFLPVYFSALYWKSVTTKAAIWSIFAGIISSIIAIVFMHQKESAAIGLCKAMFGRDVLVEKYPWPVIDPMLISLPISILILILVSKLSFEKKK